MGLGQGALGEGRSWILGLETELGSGIPALGLFWVVLSMSHPQVSGDKNEEQVLNAIEAYTEHRPEITSRAINLLFDIARIERCNQLLRALKVSSKPGALASCPSPPGGCQAWLGHPQSPCPSPGPQDPIPSLGLTALDWLQHWPCSVPTLVSAPQAPLPPLESKTRLNPAPESLFQPLAEPTPLLALASPGLPCLHTAGHHGPQVPQI